MQQNRPGHATCFPAGADVLAFASTTDTQGLVLAEAEAHGLPVAIVDCQLAGVRGVAHPAADRAGVARGRDPERPDGGLVRGALPGRVGHAVRVVARSALLFGVTVLLIAVTAVHLRQRRAA
ncbi:hypothetical protein ACIBEF_16095 [Micromonospora sp. NPDC050795]|uniref:hypothetical protein n=1 Tax=Micromonospora sp. NPDC050795 TaxID=3364282 RepID=UPI0037913B4B